MKAIEKNVELDNKGSLHVDLGDALKNKKVLVIILMEEDDIDEKSWAAFLASNPVFSFLNEEPELHTKDDGVPYKPHSKK